VSDDDNNLFPGWQGSLLELFGTVPRRRYRCDHCGVEFAERLRRLQLGAQVGELYEVLATRCPSCERWLLFLVEWDNPQSLPIPSKWKMMVRLWPQTAHAHVAPEVPIPFAAEYREAFDVLRVSPKASAALGRRLLQRVFHEHLAIKKKNLADEVSEFLATNPPSHLADAIDHVRLLGNFAAHPMTSTSSGEIVDVEAGEAEWLLDTISLLFDFVFVQPKRLALRKAALNAKLKSAGKPPLK
jgi:hypothetical protein